MMDIAANQVNQNRINSGYSTERNVVLKTEKGPANIENRETTENYETI